MVYKSIITQKCKTFFLINIYNLEEFTRILNTKIVYWNFPII